MSTLEDRVPADKVVTIADPITVTSLVAANVRDIPNTSSNVLGSASPGTEMSADALSPDQEWVRVLYDGRVAWVSRNLVTSTEPLSGLPVIGANQRGYMQEFMVHTGSDLAACSGAVPSLLIVQGPHSIPVDIVANGAHIRISSTVALWITADNELRVLVLSGSAQIGNLNLPAGFTTKAQLSADGLSIVGPWENVRPMTDDERQVLMPLEGFPGVLLNYALEIPTQADIQQMLVALAQANVQGGAQSGPASGQANCSRFKPTSPLGGMAFGNETFYWDAALGANNYRLNIYNNSGAPVGSFETGSENTALTVDVSSGSIGDGISFAWEVVALVNNNIACTTARVPVLRESGVQQAGGGGGGGQNNNPGSGGGHWGS